MSYENEIIRQERSSISLLIRGLLIAAPFVFFLMYVSATGSTIKKLKDDISQQSDAASLGEKMNDENSSLKQQISMLEDVIKLRDTIKGTNYKDIITNSEIEKTKLTDKITDLENQLQGATGKNDSQKEIQNLHDMLNQLTNDNNTLTEENKRYQTQLKNTNQDSEGQLQQLQTNLNECRNQIQNYQTENNKLNDIIKNSNSGSGDYKNQLIQLRAQLTASNKNYNDLANKNRQCETLASILRKNYNDILTLYNQCKAVK